MNYDEARPLQDGGWHWTTMRDGEVRPAAPCRRYAGPVRTSEMLVTMSEADFQTCPPHATKEEAERHFYDYSLEQVELENYAHWQDCAVCGEPTKMGLGNKGLSLYFRGDAFCSEHIGADAITHGLREAAGALAHGESPGQIADVGRRNIAMLHPFEPGISLIHS